MCTVSFYKNEDQVIITSNRDENNKRPLALPPREITLEQSTVYGPIDPLHNGTWFAVSQRGSVYVLLNGADQKHKPMPPFKRSRGLVLLDIAAGLNLEEKWNSIDLDEIENFTIVAYVKGKMALLRWDGKEKSFQYLDENKPHIWSSSTLYDEITIKKREEWFNDFLAENNIIVGSNEIINFHINTNKDDTDNGLIIKRSNDILTKNVTQVVIESNRFTLEHWDLITNEKSKIEKLIL